MTDSCSATPQPAIEPKPRLGAYLCESTQLHAAYWKKGAWNEPDREQALICMEQAVYGWKGLAYGLAEKLHAAGYDPTTGCVSAVAVGRNEIPGAKLAVTELPGGGIVSTVTDCPEADRLHERITEARRVAIATMTSDKWEDLTEAEQDVILDALRAYRVSPLAVGKPSRQESEEDDEAILGDHNIPEGQRSSPAGALDGGSPADVARDATPGSAVSGVGGSNPPEYCDWQLHNSAKLALKALDATHDRLPSGDLGDDLSSMLLVVRPVLEYVIKANGGQSVSTGGVGRREIVYQWVLKEHPEDQPTDEVIDELLAALDSTVSAIHGAPRTADDTPPAGVYLGWVASQASVYGGYWEVVCYGDWDFYDEDDNWKDKQDEDGQVKGRGWYAERGNANDDSMIEPLDGSLGRSERLTHWLPLPPKMPRPR